ncbi:hypothetical protein KFE25_004922 [Diacronema lutheri]|uniref:Uncharacterized protein n=1 Tax=Diacronema lutheri TaxID=2081491 RepID=A0A8J5XD73_DIALT|nr:hypothetical protein KFE25_004922 [Diacronema lutheri]
MAGTARRLDRAAREYGEGRVELAASTLAGALSDCMAARARADPSGARARALRRMSAALEGNAALCDRSARGACAHAACSFELAEEGADAEGEAPQSRMRADALRRALHYNAACEHARAGRSREATASLAVAVRTRARAPSSTGARARARAPLGAWLLGAADGTHDAELLAPKPPPAATSLEPPAAGLASVLRSVRAQLGDSEGDERIGGDGAGARVADGGAGGQGARRSLLACARLALWLAVSAADGGTPALPGDGPAVPTRHSASDAANWLEGLAWLAEAHARVDSDDGGASVRAAVGADATAADGAARDTPRADWAAGLGRLAARAARALVAAHERDVRGARARCTAPAGSQPSGSSGSGADNGSRAERARAGDALARGALAVRALIACVGADLRPLPESAARDGARARERAADAADAAVGLGMAAMLLCATAVGCAAFGGAPPTPAPREGEGAGAREHDVGCAPRALSQCETLLCAAVRADPTGRAVHHGLLALACARAGDAVLAPLERVVLLASAAERERACAARARADGGGNLDDADAPDAHGLGALASASAYCAMARCESVGDSEASVGLLVLLERERGRPARRAGDARAALLIRAATRGAEPGCEPAVRWWSAAAGAGAGPLSSHCLAYTRARLDARRGEWSAAVSIYASLADSSDARAALSALGVGVHELLLELAFALLRARELEDAAATAELPAGAARVHVRTAALYGAEAAVRLGRPADALAILASAGAHDDAGGADGAHTRALLAAEANARAAALAALGRWSDAAAALGERLDGAVDGGDVGAVCAPDDDPATALNRALLRLHAGRPVAAADGWRAFRARDAAMSGTRGGEPSATVARACAALDRALLGLPAAQS